MKNRTPTVLAGVAATLFVALIAIIVAWHAVPIHSRAAQAGGEVTPRKLARKYDNIKVKGEFLRAFNGAPIERLSLLASRDGKLIPIPFQIDERNRKGRFVMTGGKTAGSDEDGGALDANDELVFVISDAADRLPEAQRADMIEIEITDPRYPTQHAWAYLARYDSGKPPRSPVDYVDYDPATERIISKKYILGYRKGFMFYNDLMYPTSTGGNGQDIMDRIKVRFKVEFFKGKVTLMRNEDAVRAEVRGWIDGPVRVVQATTNHLKLFDMLPSVSFDSMSEYYPHLMASPITVRFPFDINRVIKMLGIASITADILGDHHGMVGGKAYTNISPDGFDYTGHMAKDVWEKIPKKGIVWGFATKKGVGTWFPRVIFPDPLYQYNRYYITDDVNFNNPPDDVPGEIGGGVRMVMTDYPADLIELMGQESFMLKFETYFAKPGLTPAEAKEWLDIQDHPLLVEVRAGSGITVTTPVINKKAAAGPPWKGGCDGTITDMLDRKVTLKRIAYFIGDIDVDARSFFGGERVTDASFHKFSLSRIRSMENYCVKFDPHTKTRMAIFAKLTLTDGATIELMSCRACGWAGADEEGRVVYFSNAQVKRIDFINDN